MRHFYHIATGMKLFTSNHYYSEKERVADFVLKAFHIAIFFAIPICDWCNFCMEDNELAFCDLKISTCNLDFWEIEHYIRHIKFTKYLKTAK